MSNMETSGRFPSATPLAMAYVPFQTWEEPFDASDALQAGTLFPQLDLPFMEEGYAR
ncbi:MAG: spore coat associated protein CotJA [Oscillospiraceae bacterium]|nr:spore coat associated protein CotJA [Ruminococcus sp.]MBP1565750.1 spore coat associated protein CotJA [Oscillospiraceae bacterium]MBQ9980970.1 spore coat associated protein CotJA [Oscillospiraceae bacterium]MBR6599488.1 spore coat associated protein CotJA [Oscillospiraceae bacterium]